MMSIYKGLFVQRLNGEIYGVQVEDPHGNTLSLDLPDYINRGIQPDISLLPDENNGGQL